MRRPTTHTRLARFGLLTDGPRIFVLAGGPPIATLDPHHAERLAALLESGIGFDLALTAVRAAQARDRAGDVRGAA